ncbi:hypothetical protein [Deinococcus hopiensis]|uniref:hypothetical protein n=1 Tax=Deinococcus hopiensis TaxID=309885 RepID=UPI00111C0DB3|nr:hypothetical protein [Deinococcus hopiensis]
MPGIALMYPQHVRRGAAVYTVMVRHCAGNATTPRNPLKRLTLAIKNPEKYQHGTVLEDTENLPQPAPGTLPRISPAPACRAPSP